MRTNIETYAKLIAALAETMRDSSWAEDILSRCSIISEALSEIRAEANRRLPGER